MGKYPVERLVPGDTAAIIEEFSGALRSLPAHFIEDFRLRGHHAKQILQGARLIGIEEEAILSMHDQFRNAPTGTAHHRHTESQRLENDSGQGIVHQRRRNGHVDERKKIGRVYISKKLYRSIRSEEH